MLLAVHRDAAEEPAAAADQPLHDPGETADIESRGTVGPKGPNMPTRCSAKNKISIAKCRADLEQKARPREV